MPTSFLQGAKPEMAHTKYVAAGLYACMVLENISTMCNLEDK